MARPRKNGLTYFSMDVSIGQDVKIRKLLKHKGGARALGVFTHILCQIYKEGYYADFNNDMLFIIAENLYESEEYVWDIIQYCLEIGLLDKAMFEQYNVLTSHGIQERYREVQQRIRRIATVDKYSLLETAESKVSSVQTPVSSEETKVNSEETIVNEEDIQRNASFFSVSSSNENRNRKEKKNITSTTSSPAREENVFHEIFDVSKTRIDEEIASLEEDIGWMEKASEFYKIQIEEMHVILKRFKDHCEISGKTQHQSKEDLRQHFMSWYRKQTEEIITNPKSGKNESRNNPQRTIQNSTDLRRPASVPVGARQEDFTGTF